MVERILKEEITGIAKWNKPKGGYFISLEVPGIAKEVILRCKECGLTLTDSGCAFPYHKDPKNKVIRIAPSYPKIEELELAARILSLSIKIEKELKR